MSQCESLIRTSATPAVRAPSIARSDFPRHVPPVDGILVASLGSHCCHAQTPGRAFHVARDVEFHCRLDCRARRALRKALLARRRYADWRAARAGKAELPRQKRLAARYMSPSCVIATSSLGWAAMRSRSVLSCSIDGGRRPAFDGVLACLATVAAPAVAGFAALPNTEPVTPKPTASKIRHRGEKDDRDDGKDRQVDARRKPARRRYGHERVVWTRGEDALRRPVYRRTPILPSRSRSAAPLRSTELPIFQRRGSGLPHRLQRTLFELGRADRLRRPSDDDRTFAETFSQVSRGARRDAPARDDPRLVFRALSRHAATARVSRKNCASAASARSITTSATCARCASRANATSCAANTAPSRCCARSKPAKPASCPRCNKRALRLRAIRSRSTKSSNCGRSARRSWA